MTPPSAGIVRIGGASNDAGAESTLTVDVKAKPDLSSCLRSAAPSSLERIEVIVNANDLGDLYDPLGLAGLVPFLKAGGSIAVRIVTDRGNSSIDLGPVSTSFLLAGLNAESERKEDGERVLVARKSTLSAGQKKAASAKIRINFPEEKKTADAPTKVTLDDLDDDDALIDEDELLTGGAIAAPPALDEEARAKAAEGDDCGGRTACDNCTCGRAEREAAEAAGEDKKEEGHTSHCGNCFKGDAFRCASCPYLGKPAFKPGEEHLVLDLADDL